MEATRNLIRQYQTDRDQRLKDFTDDRGLFSRIDLEDWFRTTARTGPQEIEVHPELADAYQRIVDRGYRVWAWQPLRGRRYAFGSWEESAENIERLHDRNDEALPIERLDLAVFIIGRDEANWLIFGTVGYCAFDDQRSDFETEAAYQAALDESRRRRDIYESVDSLYQVSQDRVIKRPAGATWELFEKIMAYSSYEDFMKTEYPHIIELPDRLSSRYHVELVLGHEEAGIKARDMAEDPYTILRVSQDPDSWDYKAAYLIPQKYIFRDPIPDAYYVSYDRDFLGCQGGSTDFPAVPYRSLDDLPKLLETLERYFEREPRAIDLLVWGVSNAVRDKAAPNLSDSELQQLEDLMLKHRGWTRDSRPWLEPKICSSIDQIPDLIEERLYLRHRDRSNPDEGVFLKRRSRYGFNDLTGTTHTSGDALIAKKVQFGGRFDGWTSDRYLELTFDRTDDGYRIMTSYIKGKESKITAKIEVPGGRSWAEGPAEDPRRCASGFWSLLETLDQIYRGLGYDLGLDSELGERKYPSYIPVRTKDLFCPSHLGTIGPHYKKLRNKKEFWP